MLFSLLLPVHFILPPVYYLTTLLSISDYYLQFYRTANHKTGRKAAYRLTFQQSFVKNCTASDSSPQ